MGALAQVLRDLPGFSDPNLLVGLDFFDDAGVYRLDASTGIVLTLDFFPPLVDDPFIFGQIAAANALSDVYAMGGAPLAALNIVGFPDRDLPVEILGDILRGGAERVAAAGAVIAGGHSVRDSEIKYGLSVTGRIDPRRILTNAGAQPGDTLILTKPLGTAQLTTAAKQDKIAQADLREAIDSMIELNQGACDAIMKMGDEFGVDTLAESPVSNDPATTRPEGSRTPFGSPRKGAGACSVPRRLPPVSVGGVHAVTDVTGFGLIGHACEMAQAGGMTLVIDAKSVPLLSRTMDLARAGVLTRAHRSNLDHVGDRLDASGVDETLVKIIADAQTSGGLLIAVSSDRAERLVDRLRENQTPAAAVIGTVEPFDRGRTTAPFVVVR